MTAGELMDFLAKLPRETPGAEFGDGQYRTMEAFAYILHAVGGGWLRWDDGKREDNDTQGVVIR